jgi:hypothetical protein
MNRDMRRARHRTHVVTMVKEDFSMVGKVGSQPPWREKHK